MIPVPSRKIGNKSLPDSRRSHGQLSRLKPAPALKSLRVLLFKFVDGLACRFKLVRHAGYFMAGFFFQLKNERQVCFRRSIEELEGGWPVNGALVGRKVLICVTVVIVDVNARHEIA